jgi:hypothetical protein
MVAEVFISYPNFFTQVQNVKRNLAFQLKQVLISAIDTSLGTQGGQIN